MRDDRRGGLRLRGSQTPCLGVALLLVVLVTWPAAPVAGQQPAPSGSPQPASVPTQPPEQAQQKATAPIDVRDIIRQLRHKTQTPEEQAAYSDWHRKMITVAPFIGSKPSTGFVLGAAGNVAFFRGEPSTTHISSATGSATLSTQGQVLLNAKLTAFARDDRALIVGDNRFQWTSENTYGLGANTAAEAAVKAKYDFVRVYETAYRRLAPALFAGVGLHVNAHSNVRPDAGAEASWDASPYVTYSAEHGLSLDSQTSAGASVNLLFDSRDNAINPARGWFAHASYRGFIADFLGGDSTWQELYFDTRAYYHPAGKVRHTIALWFYGDLVTGGTAPYFDLPATGMDQFGRSARGYTEGRFRGERLLYGEVEYRVSLTANGLIGVVAFANAATLTNLQSGERLFDSFAPGAGGGLRLLLDKRSRTNLCFDVGWGKGGSHGVYLAIQEAF